MTKIKVFVYRRRRQRRHRRRRGYDNSSPDFRHGELKIISVGPVPEKNLIELVQNPANLDHSGGYTSLVIMSQ